MARPPDVLLVLSDQQRPDSMGVYGQALPTTPVLDGLAADGVVFDAALTTQPVCGPSRAAIQTGRLPTDLGCWRNGLALPPDAPTMATRLSGLGYRTGYVGKWHLATDRGPRLPADRTRVDLARRPVPPERRGGYRDVWVAADALELTSGPYRGHLFDEEGRTVPLEGFRVDAVTAVAAERLERLCHDDAPFLFVVSHLEPHHQNDRLRTVGPRGAARRFVDAEVPGDLVGTAGDWRWNLAATLACTEALDRGLGRLLDVLSAHGRLDDALVVVTSDHGSHFRTRNAEYKRSPHEASLRVPLVVRGPGLRGGVRCLRPVTHLDLVPTLVAAAGGTTDDLPGRPLTEVVAGTPRPDGTDDVLVQISESQVGRAVRTPTHTFAAAAPGFAPGAGHLRSSSPVYRATHLYDLVVDPHQRRNLVDDPASAALRASLADRLVELLADREGATAAVRPDRR